MKRIVLLGPVLLTLALMLWTALVYDHSEFGSWQIYPALAVLPVVLIWHAVLIVRKAPRMPYILYALAHLAGLTPIWVGCLILLSKDSL